MRKLIIGLFIVTICLMSNSMVDAKTINEADTELDETIKYALIISLRQPIDQAIKEIYKHDKHAPKGMTWAAYNTEIIKIIQTSPGIGGMYEITFRVYPYYGAHNFIKSYLNILM